MDHGTDWQAFQRLDNASVIDFLSSTAGAMCSLGVISAKDTDDLRVVLGGIHGTAGSRDRSLLLELEAQSAAFLGLLEARFGVLGICLNLIRHTLQGALGETHQILAELGQGLVKKAELLFNRPFYIFRGGRCLKQTLYSTVIVDFAGTLADACRILTEARAELGLMNPSGMAAAGDADRQVDLAIADALGFTGLVAHALPMHTEMEIKRKVAHALALVADAAVELSEQLAANTGADAAHDVVAAGEWLKAECQRLGLLEFPRSESLMVWEVRRRNLSASVRAINEALRLLAAASLTSLAQDKAAPGPVRLPDATRRRLTFDLITAGIPPAKAKAATDELLHYLEANRLAAREMLPGELSRIHPSLLPRTLETLTALAGDAPTMGLALAEKTATMTRARQLTAAFLLATATAVTTVSGCGLKTRPTSDVLEYRPDIPYRVPEPPRKAVDAARPTKETQGAPPPGGSANDHSSKQP